MHWRAVHSQLAQDAAGAGRLRRAGAAHRPCRANGAGRPARFQEWAESLEDHPEVTDEALDAFYQNLYARGFVYCMDRDDVAQITTPCLVLAGNDEAHPFAISEEVARLLPNSEFIREWKTGDALAAARVRIQQFLTEHTPAV